MVHECKHISVQLRECVFLNFYWPCVGRVPSLLQCHSSESESTKFIEKRSPNISKLGESVQQNYWFASGWAPSQVVELQTIQRDCASLNHSRRYFLPTGI
jgi:hypothetical protein